MVVMKHERTTGSKPLRRSFHQHFSFKRLPPACGPVAPGSFVMFASLILMGGWWWEIWFWSSRTTRRSLPELLTPQTTITNLPPASSGLVKIENTNTATNSSTFKNQSQEGGESGSMTATTTTTSNYNRTSNTTVITTTSPDGTRVCHCELLSTNCLDSIACLPITSYQSQLLVAQGLQMRRLMQDVSITANTHLDVWRGIHPVGKGMQYAAIRAWQLWTANHMLPKAYSAAADTMFFNSTHYPECRAKRWLGHACFFAPFNETEDSTMSSSQDGNPTNLLESEALGLLDQVDTTMLRHHLHTSWQQGSSARPLDQLLTFAHFSRLLFTRRQHVQTFCHERLVTVRNFFPSCA